MKLIIAIINPFKLEEVRTALTEFNISGMTVTDVKGFGRQKGHKELYRGAEYVIDFLPKTRLEILVSSEMLDETIQIIISTAATGKIGDGKIFVINQDQLIRIRTGETDDEAL